MFNEMSASSSATWQWEPGRGMRASESTHSSKATEASDRERVHRTLKRVAHARALLDSREAAALREAQRIRLWELFGYTSLVDYMERELGYTARAAVERLRVANAIEVLPQVEAALEQGSLSFSGAKELTRVVTPETQEAWLEAAQDKNVRQIEEMVSGHKPGDMPSDPVDDQLRTKVLRFEVKLDTAALIRDYQKKRTRELGQMIDDDLLLREAFQIALDRIVEQRRMVDEPEAAASSDVVSRPRHQIAISMCPHCNRGWLNAAGTTTLLSPAELSYARCDSEEIGRVDIPGRPPRKRSSIPPALRRKIVARDQHRCRVPGCRSTNIDAHHIEPLALGGSHDESNVITLCEAHHLAIHRGTLVLCGTAGDATFAFVAATRFTLETRVVETKRALERRGIPRHIASAAVDAVRAHVGSEPLSRQGWLIHALEHTNLRS